MTSMSSKILARTLLAATVVLIVACAWYPPIQDLANEQVDAGLQRALISFASARTLNGLISVLQGTEVSLQPLGVGVTLTLGQVLDPVNDLVEQFSSLMLIAAVAFGVQKALLAIGAHWVISLLVTVLAAIWASLHLRQGAPAWLSGLLLVLLMVRFAIPVTTMGSDLVFQQLLAKDYQTQQASMEAASGELSELAPKGPPAGESGGWWDRMKDRAASAMPHVDYDAIRKAVEDLPERVIRLIVIFVLQTMVIPVLLLWALYRVAVAGLRSATSPFESR